MYICVWVHEGMKIVSRRIHVYIFFNLDQDGKVDRYACVDIDISFWAYIITWVCMIDLYDNGNTCTI